MQIDKEGLVSNKALERNDLKLLDDLETYVEQHEAGDPDSARSMISKSVEPIKMAC